MPALTLHDEGTYLRPNAALYPSTLHCHEVMGLHHWLDDGLGVQRPQCTQVEHLGINAHRLELLRRVQTQTHRLRVSHQGHVLTCHSQRSTQVKSVSGSYQRAVVTDLPEVLAMCMCVSVCVNMCVLECVHAPFGYVNVFSLQQFSLLNFQWLVFNTSGEK